MHNASPKKCHTHVSHLFQHWKELSKSRAYWNWKYPWLRYLNNNKAVSRAERQEHITVYDHLSKALLPNLSPMTCSAKSYLKFLPTIYRNVTNYTSMIRYKCHESMAINFWSMYWQSRYKCLEFFCLRYLTPSQRFFGRSTFLSHGNFMSISMKSNWQ